MARRCASSQSNSQLRFQAATLFALVLGPRLRVPSLVKKSIARPVLCRLKPGAPSLRRMYAPGPLRRPCRGGRPQARTLRLRIPIVSPNAPCQPLNCLSTER